MRGIATIGNAYYSDGNLQKRDAFKINNRFITGFGKKWGKVKNDSLVSTAITAIDPSLIPDINSAHNLRNIFNLTHGDLKLTDNVLQRIQAVIKRFIVGLDATLAHPGFEWDTILNEFEDFLTYDFIDDLRSSVEKDFCIEIIDIKENAA
jgi:hypothetical protein